MQATRVVPKDVYIKIINIFNDAQERLSSKPISDLFVAIAPIGKFYYISI
jgi:hypothetical protein